MTSQGQEDILTVKAATEALEAFSQRIQMFGAQVEILERRTQALKMTVDEIDILRDLEALKLRVQKLERIPAECSDSAETAEGGPPGET